MGRAQNTVKRGTFWRYQVVGGRGRGPSLLRRGEKRRTAMPRPGGPWPDLWGLRLTAGRRQKQTREPELVLLLLTDVGPIWAQVCPCLGPRLLLLWLLLLSLSSLFFAVVVVVVFGRRFAPVLALGCGGCCCCGCCWCCCCWPMLALFGRRFAPVLARGCCCCCCCCCRCRPCFLLSSLLLLYLGAGLPLSWP